MKRPCVPLVSMFATSSLAAMAGAAELQSAEVLSTFAQYEAFFEAPRRTTEARKALEDYGEGPFQVALTSSVNLICNARDRRVLQALLHVTIATTDSADESTAFALGEVYVCQPALVTTEYAALSKTDKVVLKEYLTWGFENAVGGRPANDPEVRRLREQLSTLESGAVP